MNKSPLRIGVIGLGNMGQYHVKHWQEIDNASLIAVVDTDQTRRAKFAQNGIVGFDSIDALLLAKCVDAVSITTPTFLHFKHATQCLSGGLHVLIEKPIASTVEEGKQLISLATHHNRILQVGHVERFNPAVLSLFEWKSTGLLGEPISLSSERVSPLPPQILDANVMIDLAVHDLDIISGIIGDAPIQTVIHSTSAQLNDRADSAIVSLQYPQAIATASVGWNSPIKRRTLTGYFTKGLVELDFIAQTAKFTPNDDPSSPIQKTPSSPVFPLKLELDSFASAITQQTPIAVTGLDGVNALALALTQ